MHFEKDHLYHIYNRSNEEVFFTKENYLFFLRKVNDLIKPFCEILAWCLMPNHFHFLIQATEQGEKLSEEKNRQKTQLLAKNFGVLLSSYTQAINKQERRKGKLWSHNTEAKLLTNNSLFSNRSLSLNDNYPLICFLYIHQNPVEAGLVDKMENWEFSSFVDYLNLRSGKLVNKELAYNLVNFDKDNFYAQSKIVLDEKLLKTVLNET